jgi:ApaG protein
MYRALTHDIQITVEPRFLPSESQPDQSHYIWAYTVSVANLSAHSVQLLSRHWLISDGGGYIQEVIGDGVVGKQPIIAPHETFVYTSGCSLETPEGTMSGWYIFKDKNDALLRVEIPAFALQSPYSIHTTH